MGELAERRVVIVGGGSGIGRAVALAAAAAGASVLIGGRTQEKLDATVAAAGPLATIDARIVDHVDPVSVENFLQGEERVDHLVITASAGVHGAFADLPIEKARVQFESKLFGPWRLARAAMPLFCEGSSITLFSGVLSRRPGLNCAALVAVNSAVEGLTRAMALELGPRIRVNCVSPGMVRSDAYASMPEDAREAMFEATGESLPLGRVGTVEEVAAAVVFLMTNDWTTGIVLDIDGGHIIRQYAKR